MFLSFAGGTVRRGAFNNESVDRDNFSQQKWEFHRGSMYAKRGTLFTSILILGDVIGSGVPAADLKLVVSRA